MGILRFDVDRLSNWLVIPIISWTTSLLSLFIPFFHMLLGFSITKIAVSAGIGCAGHLAVTPWLFSARPTAQSPAGKIAQTAAAVIVWISMSGLLFFYYISRDWPNDAHGAEFKRILFGITIIFGISCLIIVSLLSRGSGRS